MSHPLVKTFGFSALLAVGAATAQAATGSLGGGSGYAKNLSGRFGLGYTNELRALAERSGAPFGVSAASVKYGMSPDLTLQGLFGFFLSNGEEENDVDESGFALGAKLFYNLVREENMLFYVGGGLGLTSVEREIDRGAEEPEPEAVESDLTAFAIVGTLGVEYFIPWFPNLGFNFEYSVGLTLADQFTAFGLPNGTGGQEIANVGAFGFHYYFPAVTR